MAVNPAVHEDDIIDYGAPPELSPRTQEQFEAMVAAGIWSAENEPLIPHEQVVAEMKALLASFRAR